MAMIWSDTGLTITESARGFKILEFFRMKEFVPVRVADGIVSDRQAEQFYKRIDESYGVTLGLSRLIRYIVFMTEKCIMLSSKKSLQNLSRLSDVILDYKRKVTENFTEDCFWISLGKADARVINLDLEDSALCIRCRTFDSEDIFAETVNFDGFGKIYSTTDETKSGDIIGKIFIEIIQYPIYQNGYFMYYQKFTGGTEFVKVTELIHQIQHEFNHMHKEHVTKYQKDYERAYADLMILVQNERGVVQRFADYVYRYCVWDELNAFTEQAFREYQTAGSIKETNSWKLAEQDENYLKNIFKPDIKKINKLLYDNFYDICRSFLNMRQMPATDKEKFFVKSLVKKIIEGIEIFKKKMTRLINVPVSESMTYIGKLNEGNCKIGQRINIWRHA